ncbi:MAG: hypothetical protein RDV48_17930 [Candidatus Eremiobacteraeota bacterium]|nr:hypothetical protein [Candidatus Eremiobacteraeota bacterium]
MESHDEVCAALVTNAPLARNNSTRVNGSPEADYPIADDLNFALAESLFRACHTMIQQVIFSLYH